MKFFLLVILGFNLAALAVDRPVGFAGIQWGASPEEAKRALQKREGVKFPEESDDYRIEVAGGTFAGQPVAKWVLEFPGRKFASAAVTLKTEGNASAVFRAFRSQLSEKYGPATTGKSLSAGKGTKGVPYGTEQPVVFGSVSTWRFAGGMKDKTRIVVIAELAGPNGKAASDESQLGVTIKYVNESLAGPLQGAGPDGTRPAQVSIKKEDL